VSVPGLRGQGPLRTRRTQKSGKGDGAIRTGGEAAGTVEKEPKQRATAGRNSAGTGKTSRGRSNRRKGPGSPGRTAKPGTQGNATTTPNGRQTTAKAGTGADEPMTPATRTRQPQTPEKTHGKAPYARKTKQHGEHKERTARRPPPFGGATCGWPRKGHDSGKPSTAVVVFPLAWRLPGQAGIGLLRFSRIRRLAIALDVFAFVTVRGRWGYGFVGGWPGQSQLGCARVRPYSAGRLCHCRPFCGR